MSHDDGNRTETELREQVHALVQARARAEAEAGRLDDLDGERDLAERYRLLAARLAGEIEGLRTHLRGRDGP